MAGLQPPAHGKDVEDPGAHEPDISDDEHFSDASEGKQVAPPIPTTRVEKTDDQPSHGEVPGTAAYDIRTQDASPDEVEVIPESKDQSHDASPSIPQTVVEKVDPDQPGHGDVEGTYAHDLRKADASPDVIKKAPDVTRTDLEDETNGPFNDYAPSMPSDDFGAKPVAAIADDDFDDFAEGGSEDEDDFGAFDQGQEEGEDSVLPPMNVTLPAAAQLSLPILSFEDTTTLDDVTAATQSYMNELFPMSASSSKSDLESLPDFNPSFLTERSQSLWEQLIAPPPLQPPDWVRSRVRRLFLVSLGVPVDLDEILPASKQKKLILPSIDLESGDIQSNGEQVPTGVAVERLKRDAPNTGSRSPSTSKSERRRRGPPPPPAFDAGRARLMCSTTATALSNFTDPELCKHVEVLEGLKHGASQLLEYWLVQKDSASRNKEAFEEVINNLVKHAKKVRK